MAIRNLPRIPAVAREYTAGTHTFPADSQRQLFAMDVDGAEGSVTLGDGVAVGFTRQQEVVSPSGWVPTLELVVVCSATILILATDETHSSVVST